MDRRKFLIGAGSLAAGGAAAVGTGAFTSVTADRGVSVEVAGDSSAFLAIQNAGGDNSSDYVDTSGSEVSFDFSETDNSGSGLNTGATTKINDLVNVVNQGTQDLDFYLTVGSNLEGFMNRVTFSTDDQGSKEGLLGSTNSIVIPVGQSITLDLEVFVPEKSPTLTNNSGTLTFNAEATGSGGSS